MLTKFLLSIALMTILAAPSQAQTTLRRPACDQTVITDTERKLAEMQDGRQKQIASSEVESAKERLKQGQIEECQDHLLKASVQMK